ncbi:hypothetical protein RhiirA4_486017 [Rhizophagus irregularis]|uniref:LysM domain-containing protein n=1 Tax=Rhizophagus irregularis TaxID=588596 RepID=A0A2I1HQX5_9GLOM|nr:hypothetical protein RhiirA4_486017 [Rhizophagus irregularis]
MTCHDLISTIDYDKRILFEISLVRISVRQGDTLYAIANAFHISLQALEAANPGVTPDRIYPGQAIWIP